MLKKNFYKTYKIMRNCWSANKRLIIHQTKNCITFTKASQFNRFLNQKTYNQTKIKQIKLYTFSCNKTTFNLITTQQNQSKTNKKCNSNGEEVLA